MPGRLFPRLPSMSITIIQRIGLLRLQQRPVLLFAMNICRARAM